MTEISQSQSETLAQRLERGPIEPQAALAILEQLLTSLEPVHAGGAVNGRITPEVIRLEPDGRATFAESEAEVSGGDPRAAGDSGLPDNPGYMAPELISGDFVDARTDVFALGVITYEMLTGTNPFSAGEGAPPGTVVYRIVYRPYPEIAQSAVPGLTADIRSMVATAMARDPGSRFADAKSFLEALRPAASSLKGAGLAAGVAVAAGAGAAKAAAQPKGKEPKGRSKGKAEPIPAAGVAAAGAAGKAAAAGMAAKGTGAPPPPAPGPPGPEEGGFVDSALEWIFEVRRNWAPYFLAGAVVILGLVIVLLVIMYRAEDTAATDTTTVAASTSTSTTARAVLPTDATTTTILPSTTVTTASSTLTTVKDKLPATVTLSALAATYTGSPVNPAVQTEPDGLIVLLTYSQGDKPVDAPVNAGTYTVTATVDDTQYQGTTTGTLEIRKANASINVFGWSGTYTGSPHGATGSATGVKGENLGSLMSFPDSYTNVPGGTSRWRFAGNTNYNSANGSVGIVISKAKATISVSGWNRAYDGKPHGAVLNYARGVLGESLSSLVKLGSQTYTSPPGGPALWTFAGNLNYLSAAGSVGIAISKANATINVSGWTGEYDGFAHGADGSARGVLGENLSGLLNLGSSFSSVGTHTAYWTFAGNNNYYSDSGSVPIVITEPPTTTTTTTTTEVPPPPGP